MASGHVNRANRPNTWQLRPTLQREDSPCQPGAVHTWPKRTTMSELSPMRSKADILKICRSTIEMFRPCWLFYSIAKSTGATAGTARE
jgi:hypothetical protein